MDIVQQERRNIAEWLGEWCTDHYTDDDEVRHWQCSECMDKVMCLEAPWDA